MLCGGLFYHEAKFEKKCWGGGAIFSDLQAIFKRSSLFPFNFFPVTLMDTQMDTRPLVSINVSILIVCNHLCIFLYPQVRHNYVSTDKKYISIQKWCINGYKSASTAINSVSKTKSRQHRYFIDKYFPTDKRKHIWIHTWNYPML